MSDAYKTETRESGTMSFRVEWVYDHDTDAPQDSEDGHGPVSDWERREKKPGERAHAAAMADYERLRQWCTDQWHYCGIVVTLLNADGEPDSIDASLWGIESDSPDHHDEVINDLIAECLTQITATIGE